MWNQLILSPFSRIWTAVDFITGEFTVTFFEFITGVDLKERLGVFKTKCVAAATIIEFHFLLSAVGATKLTITK